MLSNRSIMCEGVAVDTKITRCQAVGRRFCVDAGLKEQVCQKARSCIEAAADRLRPECSIEVDCPDGYVTYRLTASGCSPEVDS